MALKICAPDRDFAVESKAQILGGTERSTEALGLWMSNLDCKVTEGSKMRMLQKCKVVRNLVALVRGIAQVWQDGPRLAPPVTPQLLRVARS